MSQIIHLPLSDLLPPAFDEIATEAVGEHLLPKVREAVLLSLNNTLRLCALAGDRESSPSKGSPGPAEKSGLKDTLLTADHFGSHWFSRSETVERIARSSGLSRKVAHFSLLLVESRIDMALLGWDSVRIETFGQISDGDTEESDTRSRLRTWYETVLVESTSHSGKYLDDSVLCRWFCRRSRLSHAFMDRIEVAAVFRPPMPYRIQIAFAPHPEPTGATGHKKKMNWSDSASGAGSSSQPSGKGDAER